MSLSLSLEFSAKDHTQAGCVCLLMIGGHPKWTLFSNPFLIQLLWCTGPRVLLSVLASVGLLQSAVAWAVDCQSTVCRCMGAARVVGRLSASEGKRGVMPWSEGSTGEPSDTAGLSVQAAANNVEGQQTAVSGCRCGGLLWPLSGVALVRPPTSLMGSPQK